MAAWTWWKIRNISKEISSTGTSRVLDFQYFHMHFKGFFLRCSWSYLLCLRIIEYWLQTQQIWMYIKQESFQSMQVKNETIEISHDLADYYFIPSNKAWWDWYTHTFIKELLPRTSESDIKSFEWLRQQVLFLQGHHIQILKGVQAFIRDWECY